MQDLQEGILQRQSDISQDLVSEVPQKMLFLVRGEHRLLRTIDLYV